MSKLDFNPIWRRIAAALLLALLTTTALGCSGRSGGDDDEGDEIENRWNRMQWDRGEWAAAPRIADWKLACGRRSRGVGRPRGTYT